MQPVDYVINDLLMPPGYRSVRFVPHDQCQIFEEALRSLSLSGTTIFKVGAHDVDSEISLLATISEVISAPTKILHWDIFIEELTELDWLGLDKSDCFFYFARAMSFWRSHSMLAGMLVNAFEPISYNWMRKNSRMVLIFGMEE